MIEPAAGVVEAPVRVTFVPTTDDLVEASQAAVRTGTTRRRRWVSIGVPLVLSVLIVDRMQRGDVVVPAVSDLWLVVPLLLVLAAAFGSPLLVRWAVVRQRRQNPHYDGPVTYTFTADGMHAQTPLGVTEMPWSSFVRASETPGLILLYFGYKSAYFVPRRALREDDERRLKTWLAARLGAQARLTNESTGR